MQDDRETPWPDPELEESADELYEHFGVTVDRGQGMIRIDKYLTERIEGASRSRVQAAADAGNVLVNERSG